MTVFWYLLLGHLLADFVFKDKDGFYGRSVKYCLWRGFVYFAVLSLCCYKYLELPWIDFSGIELGGLFSLGLAGLAYFVYAFFERKNERGRKALFLFAGRQFILLSVLFIIMPVIPFDGDFLHYIYGPDLLFVVNGSLIAGYVISELLINLSLTIDKPIDAKSLFDQRFHNMLLRVVLFLLIIIPGWFGVAVAAAAMAFLIKHGIFRDDKFYFYIGCALTLVFGLICKGIFHGIC